MKNLVSTNVQADANAIPMADTRIQKENCYHTLDGSQPGNGCSDTTNYIAQGTSSSLQYKFLISINNALKEQVHRSTLHLQFR